MAVVPARRYTLALDVGCGAGRWAYEVQRRGPRVIALDLGMSIELAARNTLGTGKVACVQGDVRQLPVRDGRIDLAYSLGVLHHVEETERALREVARVIRPGGLFLVYLYYALETRPLLHRLILRMVDWVRRVTSRLPQPLLVAFSTAVAALVYLPLARAALLLRRLGLRRASEALPLSFYADLSFRTMRNDSLDRFGTALEKRHTREEVRSLLESVGLRDVAISPNAPYWHAIARGAGVLGGVAPPA